MESHDLDKMDALERRVELFEGVDDYMEVASEEELVPEKSIFAGKGPPEELERRMQQITKKMEAAQALDPDKSIFAAVVPYLDDPAREIRQLRLEKAESLEVQAEEWMDAAAEAEEVEKFRFIRDKAYMYLELAGHYRRTLS